jgi:3,4-dihydroxy 2-butanone 4-phosphate synthase/GTP cyclohydrolase II
MAGPFKIIAFGNEGDLYPHVVLLSDVEPNEVPIVRIHSECMTGDLFGSARCDCGAQLNTALDSIANNGGALLYLRQEGRGIGLVEKLKAYNLQDNGRDTIQSNEDLGHPVDARDYDDAVLILNDLKFSQIQLMTNNPLKISALKSSGIDVVKRLPVVIPAGKENARYLEVKQSLMGHLLG